MSASTVPYCENARFLRYFPPLQMCECTGQPGVLSRACRDFFFNTPPNPPPSPPSPEGRDHTRYVLYNVRLTSNFVCDVDAGVAPFKHRLQPSTGTLQQAIVGWLVS